MQLYFIRHGQSTNNLLWLQTRSSDGRSADPELTETGRQQAAALAQYLSRTDATTPVNGPDGQNVAGFGITHLYSSLMVRAVATGTVLAQVLDLPLVAWKDLHEAGGIYLTDEETGERIGAPGKSRGYFEANYPDLVLPQSLDHSGWWKQPYEEYEQRFVRARRVLDELMERHGGTEDRVAVISHGAFYNYLLAELLALPRRNGYWFALHNTAITRIDFRDDDFVVTYSNRADFLPKELVT
jgi:2,3-bisphosphoglycerate-dependent phosphoglycerate mutase